MVKPYVRNDRTMKVLSLRTMLDNLLWLPHGLNPHRDPTFLFLIQTFWSILFVEADDKTKSLSLRMPQFEEVVAHTTDPAVFIGFAELAVFLYLVRGSRAALTRSESLVCNWHLWNAILTYTMMDGLNGAFSEAGFLPMMHKRAYQLVDRRYRRDQIGAGGVGSAGPSAFEANFVKVLGSTELFVYAAITARLHANCRVATY